MVKTKTMFMERQVEQKKRQMNQILGNTGTGKTSEGVSEGK